MFTLKSILCGHIIHCLPMRIPLMEKVSSVEIAGLRMRTVTEYDP